MGGKIFEQREEEREEDFVSFLSRLASIETSMTKFFLYLRLEHSASYLYARVIVPEENNRHVAQ